MCATKGTLNDSISTSFNLVEVHEDHKEPKEPNVIQESQPDGSAPSSQKEECNKVDCTGIPGPPDCLPHSFYHTPFRPTLDEFGCQDSNADSTEGETRPISPIASLMLRTEY